MGIYGLKPAFRRLLGGVAAPFYRMTPNAVSGLAVLCALAAGGLLWTWSHAPWVLLVVPLLLFLRIAFNALDGMVAQKRDMCDPRGEFVNEGSDRLNDTLILGGLALSGTVTPWLVLSALVVTLLVSYVGILPRAAGGQRRYNGPMGKADRMLWLGLGCVAAWIVDRLASAAQDAPLPGAAPPEPHQQAAWVLGIAMWIIVVGGGITILNRSVRAWRDLGAGA